MRTPQIQLSTSHRSPSGFGINGNYHPAVNSRVSKTLGLWVLVLGFAWPVGGLHGAEPTSETIAISDRPYRVNVRIHIASSPDFDSAGRTTLLNQTADGLECCVGSFWNTLLQEELGSTFSSAAALKRLSTSALHEQTELAGFDKVFLIAVMSFGAEYQVAGREWDATTRQLGPMASRIALDRREVPSTLLALIHQLFRPLAEIDQPRNGNPRLQPQGGHLAPADSPWPAVAPGQLFEPFHCALDKDLAIERIQPVPWTYLVASPEPDTGQVDATPISGLRSPISPRKHRLLPLALAINDRGPETRLTLVTRATVRKPLAGVEVELSHNPSGNRPAQAGTTDTPTAAVAAPLPKLITDRNGKVTVDAHVASENKPIWMFVRSGQVLLARVPYLPGLRPVETMELPDDSLRLEVEGDIALLQAKLVDTVARRAVLMASAKSRAKANQFDAATAALAELDAMPKAPKFLDDLNLIRINRSKLARARRDKNTEERIRKLVLETTELVTTYLDENKLTELKDDIRELRRVADDNAALEAQDAAAAKQLAPPAGQAPPATPASPPPGN
ncbi:MAG: hypothetical protein JSS02_29910 [Planctomycetes bacterium]|nr:hypothetical protein [Planctomycetota bacterium]